MAVWGVHKAAGAVGGEAGRTFGGAMGYSSGKKSSNLKMPSASEWRGGIPEGKRHAERTRRGRGRTGAAHSHTETIEAQQ